MSKQRMVNTRFWSDGFIRSKLNPLDRYLFLYFLTNERTTICGVYELPIEIISSETGIEKETIEKMMPRLEGRVELFGSWVIVPNFLKHQSLNPSVILGIQREYNALPEPVRDRVYTAWVQAVGNLTKLNLTKPIGRDEPPIPKVEEERKSTKFQKPTIEEIKAYIKEKNYNVDANRFFNFYESKGWKVGKNPMVSWKASVATWQKDEPKTTPNRAVKEFKAEDTVLETEEERLQTLRRLKEIKNNVFKR